MCQQSHSLKPVRRLSSQTTLDAAPRSYKTHWNYCHSNHNNNMPGQHPQGGRGWRELSPPPLPAAPGTSPAAPTLRPAPRPVAASSTPLVRATLPAGACFGNGWSHHRGSLAPLLCPARGEALRPGTHMAKSHAAGSPGPRQSAGNTVQALLQLLNPDVSQPSRAQVSLPMVLNRAAALGAVSRRGMKTQG